ncbi:ABC transporter ATP-binding protein [Streptomyces sp. x-80]|uniref:ABC transporter ATP-binding protein n=1 Tax=Streptomyces sp. x-80 TaxID=2789282 RepID=UPI00397F13FC
MIVCQELTKRYGDKTVVDKLSFTVQPGRVTGFLGPNGAGKSTTMRMILGLDAPDSGSATVNGHPYVQLPAPLRTVGALLNAGAVLKSRSAYGHLRGLAASNGLPASRVDEVLEIVGLTDAAKKRAGGFSLGMGQRLGIAAALLGDPEVVILDEPVNGLDPEGIRWIRGFMRYLAAEGRTVFLSSHLMSEMQDTADHLVVIGKGRLVADCSMEELLERSGPDKVLVGSADASELAARIAHAGYQVTQGKKPDTFYVAGATAEFIGKMASTHGLGVYELTPQRAALEDVFRELTSDSVEYRTKSSGKAT